MADFPDPLVVVAPFFRVVVVELAAWHAVSFLAHLTVACCVAVPAAPDPVPVVPVGGPESELPELLEVPAAEEEPPEGPTVVEWAPPRT